MAEEKKSADEGGEAKAGGGLASKMGLILKVLFIVLNLGTVGGGATLVYLSTLGHEPPKITEEDQLANLEKIKDSTPENPIVFTMDKFTVNLDGRPKRMIQTQLNLEMLDEEGFEEVVRLGPQARDEVVRLLGSKTFADIESVQGKLFLKDQIAAIVNHSLKRGVVKDVFFSEFVVQ